MIKITLWFCPVCGYEDDYSEEYDEMELRCPFCGAEMVIIPDEEVKLIRKEFDTKVDEAKLYIAPSYSISEPGSVRT